MEHLTTQNRYIDARWCLGNGLLIRADIHARFTRFQLGINVDVRFQPFVDHWAYTTNRMGIVL